MRWVDETGDWGGKIIIEGNGNVTGRGKITIIEGTEIGVGGKVQDIIGGSEIRSIIEDVAGLIFEGNKWIIET